MARLKGAVSLIAITAGVLLALRLLHLALPIVYPLSNPGPFVLDRVEQVAPYAGFEPYVPFYRPELLGEAPPRIVVTRVEFAQVTMSWSGQHSLEIVQQLAATRPRVPAAAQPMEGVDEVQWWADGPDTSAMVWRDGVAVALHSDLPREQLRRVILSLKAR